MVGIIDVLEENGNFRLGCTANGISEDTGYNWLKAGDNPKVSGTGFTKEEFELCIWFSWAYMRARERYMQGLLDIAMKGAKYYQGAGHPYFLKMLIDRQERIQQRRSERGRVPEWVAKMDEAREAAIKKVKE